MNREQRRKSGTKAKEKVYYFKESDLDAFRNDCTTKALKMAMSMMLSIPVMVLHDKYSKIMKKDGREKTFALMCIDLYKAWEEGYITFEDLEQCLKDEAGITIEGGAFNIV